MFFLFRKIRKAARALLYQSRKHTLPEPRRKELENIILQHYLQYDEITEELLEEAANIQIGLVICLIYVYFKYFLNFVLYYICNTYL